MIPGVSRKGDVTSHRNHRFGGGGVPVPDSIRTTAILCLLKATGILLLSQTRNLGPRKKHVLPWSVAGFRAGTGTQFPNCKCFVNCTGQWLGIVPTCPGHLSRHVSPRPWRRDSTLSEWPPPRASSCSATNGRHRCPNWGEEWPFSICQPPPLPSFPL